MDPLILFCVANQLQLIDIVIFDLCSDDNFISRLCVDLVVIVTQTVADCGVPLGGDIWECCSGEKAENVHCV